MHYYEIYVLYENLREKETLFFYIFFLMSYIRAEKQQHT